MFYAFSNGTQGGGYIKPNAGLINAPKWSEGVDGPPVPIAHPPQMIQNQGYVYTPIMYPQCVNRPTPTYYPQQSINKSPPSPNSRNGKQGVASLAEVTRTGKLREQLTPIILNHINEKTEDFFNYPNLASKVIRAFMEKDNMELSLMLRSRDLFEARFDEAIAGIKADEAKYKAANPTACNAKIGHNNQNDATTRPVQDGSPKTKPKTVVVVKHNMNAIASLKDEIEKLKLQRDDLNTDLEEMKKEFEAKEKRQNLVIEDLKLRSKELNDIGDLTEKMEYVKNKEEELKSMRLALEQQFKKTKAETKCFREQKEKVRKMREELVKENNALDEKIALLQTLEQKIEVRNNVEEQRSNDEKTTISPTKKQKKKQQKC